MCRIQSQGGASRSNAFENGVHAAVTLRCNKKKVNVAILYETVSAVHPFPAAIGSSWG